MKFTTLALAMGLGLVATTARAEDQASINRATLVYAAAAVADVSTTYYCLSAPDVHGFGCRERNPAISWMAPRFSQEGHEHVMLAVGEAVDLAAVLALRKVGGSHPKLARVGLYVAAGVRVALAARNIREGQQQRER